MMRIATFSYLLFAVIGQGNINKANAMEKLDKSESHYRAHYMKNFEKINKKQNMYAAKEKLAKHESGEVILSDEVRDLR